ncbi:hypothetical protein [Nocardioides sp. YIM 152588]|uniref:hypothetical protein n=1 Tax=Nocardioides sp. YIM 152588 TaxID=3158259 RepID=UPI0032E4C1F4
MAVTTHRTHRSRPAQTARRAGYVVAIVVNLVVLFLIHGWPGWDAVPFLSPETTEVLPYVDASIAVGILANAVYVVRDGPAVKATGDLVTTLVSLVVLLQVWQVFPFDFAGVWAGWEPLTYVLLGVATFGTVIASMVQAVTLARLAASSGNDR